MSEVLNQKNTRYRGYISQRDTPLMEILSYIKDWKRIIGMAAKSTKYLFVSLYIPVNPIGYVKKHQELIREIVKYFNIQEKIEWNDEALFVFAENKIK